MPRRGRRAGGEDTRAQILDAARRSFAEKGYDRTTIRGVASMAAVDPALVHHYFGRKEDLFTAAVDIPFRLDEALPEALGEDLGTAGVRVAGLFFAIWEHPAARNALLGQLRHALTTGEPPAIAGFVSRAVLHRVAGRMEGENRELRAELVASHLLGVAILRYVVGMEPLASAATDELIAMVAPRIQTYLA